MNTLELKLSFEEIQPIIDEVYFEAQRSISLPGFRKGKVPMHMIKKMYGKSLDAEANLEIVNQFFPKVAEEDNLVLIDKPILKDVQKNDDGMTYIISFQTVPQYEIKGYKDLEIYEPVYVVKPEDIDEELNAIALENANRTQANQIESFDYIAYVGIENANEEHDHNHHSDHHHHEHRTIYLGDKNYKLEFREMFLNRSIGETFEYNEGDNKFKVVIENIEKVELPQIDDEFVKKVTHNKFDNLGDFRQQLELDIQDYWDEKSRREIENQIVDHLILNNPEIVPPDAIINHSLNFLVEDFKRKNNIHEKDKQYDQYLQQSLYPYAVNMAKWSIIRDQIAKDESIVLEEYDYDLWLEKNQRFFPTTGLNNDDIKEYIKKDENLKNTLLQNKVIDFILGYATTNEISFEDYYNKMKLKNVATDTSSNENDSNDNPSENDNLNQDEEKKEE